VRSHDLLISFDKYFDTEAVVDSAVDWAWERTKREMEEEKPENEWEEMGYELGKGLAELMFPVIKARLKDEVRREITKLIEGETTEPTKGGRQEQARFRFGNLRLAKVKRDGKVAKVWVTNSGLDGSLILKMRQTPERYWRVVEIDPRILKSLLE